MCNLQIAECAEYLQVKAFKRLAHCLECGMSQHHVNHIQCLCTPTEATWTMPNAAYQIENLKPDRQAYHLSVRMTAARHAKIYLPSALK